MNSNNPDSNQTDLNSFVSNESGDAEGVSSTNRKKGSSNSSKTKDGLKDANHSEKKSQEDGVENDWSPGPELASNPESKSQGASGLSTGSELADEYLLTVSGADVSEQTAKGYESCLRMYVRYLNRNGLSVAEAEANDVIDFYREGARQNLAMNTLKSRQTSINQLYEHLYLEADVEVESQFLKLKQIDISSFQARESKYFEPMNEEELDKLFDAASTQRNKLMMAVGAEIGARNRDLRSIKVENIDFEDDEIEFYNHKSDRKHSVPISGELAMKLERWIQFEKSASQPEESNPYLFPSGDGGKLENNGDLRDIVCGAAEDAGIQEVIHERPATEAEKQYSPKMDTVKFYRITPHSLRHTFSHLLDQAGLSTKARSEALDHDSIEVTENHYTFSESDYKNLIRKILH